MPSSELKIPSGQSVSFSDQCIGDDGVREVCTALDARRDVTALDLRGCHVHATGAAATGVATAGAG